MVNGAEYTATNTRIYFSVDTFNSGVLLYFYRDSNNENKTLYVGYNPSNPAGSAEFVSLTDTLNNFTVGEDYTYTEWVP
jgi:hypothetical protein